ncbi:MAG: hypothetical protein LBR41_00295 [Rickettsiales bacterium]|nr:hypothetical protein [Rickettsiales bacterium]
MLILKYILAIVIVAAIFFAPAWIASQRKLNKLPDMGMVRCSSWLFGWTGLGWLFGLCHAFTEPFPDK